MEKDVFAYLDKDYRYLNNYIRDINDSLLASPHTSIIKGKTYIEKITQEISKLKGYGLLSNIPQVERLSKLEFEGVISGEIEHLFHEVILIGKNIDYLDADGELEAALKIHMNIYKITCWFVKNCLYNDFEPAPYKNPIPSKDSYSKVDLESINEISSEISLEFLENKKDIEDASMNELIGDIFNEELDKKCLIDQLSKLKQSSKEAVESLGEFTPFKKYMHITRDAQNSLEKLILAADASDRAQLILVCGSVGDGKSHIISYFNNKYSEIMKRFTLHNDATESLEPEKTSMDTLNDVLNEFSDEKIDESKQKFILAINLGTLNNFIDSEDYGERFTKLRKFVEDKKILETSIEDSSFDNNSSFQFVNFGDYHIFTLKEGRVDSDYVKSLIRRISCSVKTDSIERNIFHISYNKNCTKCENKECCPIKANYELLVKDNVQDAIVELLVQCIVKNKIIISTRALLNFMYELIVPRSYIDVNSPTFKNKILKLKRSDYIKSLIPNIIFEHKELSFIFEALSEIDPLNVRNEKLDDFIVEFNNTNEIFGYFNKYIDYSEGYIDKLLDIDFTTIEGKQIREDLLRLFIRSYYICGKEELFQLRDEVYDEYMNAVYYWNKGDKAALRKVYNNVREGIINWNGEADKDYMNIFMGKNQVKYKVSEKIELKVDTSNLPNNGENDLKKFIETIKLKYKGENSGASYEIDIDYSLYKLLVQVNNGYRPNKKDKNHFIKFIEIINKLQETGSQKNELKFTEKNKEDNRQFKLEYDEEFESYRFVEI